MERQKKQANSLLTCYVHDPQLGYLTIASRCFHQKKQRSLQAAPTTLSLSQTHTLESLQKAVTHLYSVLQKHRETPTERKTTYEMRIFGVRHGGRLKAEGGRWASCGLLISAAMISSHSGDQGSTHTYTGFHKIKREAQRWTILAQCRFTELKLEEDWSNLPLISLWMCSQVWVRHRFWRAVRFSKETDARPPVPSI